MGRQCQAKLAKGTRWAERVVWQPVRSLRQTDSNLWKYSQNSPVGIGNTARLSSVVEEVSVARVLLPTRGLLLGARSNMLKECTVHVPTCWRHRRKLSQRLLILIFNSFNTFCVKISGHGSKCHSSERPKFALVQPFIFGSLNNALKL